MQYREAEVEVTAQPPLTVINFENKIDSSCQMRIAIWRWRVFVRGALLTGNINFIANSTCTSEDIENKSQYSSSTFRSAMFLSVWVVVIRDHLVGVRQGFGEADAYCVSVTIPLVVSSGNMG